VSHRNGESAQNRKLSWSPDVSLEALDEMRFPYKQAHTSPGIYQIEQLNFNSYPKLVINLT
jgi:hypothetical protein